MSGAAGPLANDVSGNYVGDEGRLDKAFPGRDTGEIAHPEAIGARCSELAADLTQRARRLLVAVSSES